ncbi:circularly permuted type 2 ATP-grasp protein [Ruania halotolerans]|uniref:circularly permuted type 2 ATP-grasp protein n=1 Tax=Ruania halotolerans TaxID=2897773 RepID=UPI001E4AD071|nr:circularly permuted type 2 ATP-grasp protein [Ruania halotolerans]UFU06222.1 circularly permuted type 2 ATP-grasp protein [Ruania halotolerans]
MSTVADLLASYLSTGPGHDEMLQSTGAARAAWDQMADLAQVRSWDQLADRRQDVATLLEDHGARYGAEPHEVPWQLDPLPLILDEVEWAQVEASIRQRAELLDAILTDLYGERRLLATGLLPQEIVLDHPGFLRTVDGITIPGPHQLFLYAADLARNADGSWVVLSDRAQAPSGLGFAMEDRRVVSQVLAGSYRQARIRRIGPFYHAMSSALRDVAPVGAGDEPRIALLTPGPFSETAFDQGYLAQMLGLPLVEGEDLVVTDGRLWMRSLAGLEPVDILIRRVDAEYCDPLDLRGDSRLGVPGLVHAARSGALTVVNPFGAGVIENPALMTYLPRLARELLGEELQLGSAVTYWCGERSMCSHVIANLDRLMIRRTIPGGRQVFGGDLTVGARADLAVEIAADPYQWVGQEPVDASTTPTIGADTLEARPTALRTFALARASGYQVMSGGLARVDRSTTDLAQNPPAQPAAAKDVWILSAEPQPVQDPWLGGDQSPHQPAVPAISPGAAEDLFWFGRYIERAEATVRLIRAVADRWDDYHLVPGSVGGQTLSILTAALNHVTTDGTLSEALLEEQREGSVAFAVARAVRAATGVRDQLSGDTWIALSSVERALARERVRRLRLADSDADLGGALARSLEGLLALAGIGAEAMVRDVGWALMDIGRRLERAQHLVHVLRATVTDERDRAVDSMVLESVLIAHESVITYRRRTQAHARLDTFLDLLLLDRNNPRSLAYQLTTLRADLDSLPTAAHNAQVRDQLLADLTDLLIEHSATALSGSDETGRRLRLAELLESLDWRLRDLAVEIARVHFAHPVPIQWEDAAGTWVPRREEVAP